MEETAAMSGRNSQTDTESLQRNCYKEWQKFADRHRKFVEKLLREVAEIRR